MSTQHLSPLEFKIGRDNGAMYNVNQTHKMKIKLIWDSEFNSNISFAVVGLQFVGEDASCKEVEENCFLVRNKDGSYGVYSRLTVQRGDCTSFFINSKAVLIVNKPIYRLYATYVDSDGKVTGTDYKYFGIYNGGKAKYMWLKNYRKALEERIRNASSQEVRKGIDVD
jgi:hypothetical protein